MTFAEFVTEHNVTLDAKVRSYAIEKSKPFVWDCVIKFEGRKYEFKYTMGCANCTIFGKNASYQQIQDYRKKIIWGEILGVCGLAPSRPEIADVLNSLHSDTSFFFNGGVLWEDFADELGMNKDSIKDKNAFKACRKAYGELKKFFKSNLDTFIQCEE